MTSDPPTHTGTDDPQELLKVGTKMNEALIEAVEYGLSQDEDEDEMILAVYNGLCNQPLRQTAANALAGIFAAAKARKWDLVLVNEHGTRVVIRCDTEEEQTQRALDIMTKEQLSQPNPPFGLKNMIRTAEGDWVGP